MLKRFLTTGFIFIFMLSLGLVSCGDDEKSSNGNMNIYNHISFKGRSIKGSEEEYTAAKAVAYMNAKKIDEAIECLEDYLQGDSDALSLESLLVTAYFQKIGIDFLSIVTKFIKQDYGSINTITDGHYNDLVTIVSKIIDDQETSMIYMEKAEVLLDDLEARSTLDQYDLLKKSINKIVLVSLSIMKIADKFSKGFTQEDLDSITLEDAQKILDRLADSGEAVGELIGLDNLSEEDIATLQSEVDKFINEMNDGEEELDDEAKIDKIKAYIQANYNIIL